MPARWQQWMPFHIDRFRGSAYVRAMKPAARAGYLYLLSEQWQSEDCTLPNDMAVLMILSGLDAEEWEQHALAILRHFPSIAGDKLQNKVLFEEWTEAKRVFEARQAGARRVNERSPSAERAVSVRRADTQTYTGTGTSTETEKKEELLASSPTADSASFISLPTNRQKQEFHVLDSHLAEWGKLYPGIDVRQQVRNMRGWLDGNPVHRKTLKGTPAFIHRWLGKAQDKATVPIPATGTPSKPFDPCTPKETPPSGITSDQVEQWRRDKAEGKVIPAHAIFAVERIEKREATR